MMAGEIPPVTVEVIVDASGVVKGFTTVQEGLTRITEKTKSINGVMGSLKTTMLGVFGGNIATQGFMALEHAVMQAKQEFLDAQVETQRLGQALENMGVHSENTREQILKNVEAYSTLGFEGAESARAMGTLITATGDVTQSTKLMAMAANLARYRHIDLGTAATILARGTQGSARAFKELGITLDTTIPKNQAIAKAFDQLNNKISGQAVAYTKTFAGQMAVLKERMQEVFNVIAKTVLPILSAFLGYIIKNGQALLIYGGIVLGVIVILKTYKATVTALKAVQQAYAFWTYAQAASTSVFRFALSSLWTTMKANPIGFTIAALMALGAAFVWTWNKFKGFREGIVKGLQIITNGFGYLTGAVAKMLGALSRVPGFGGLKGAAKAASDAANNVRKFSDNLDKLVDKKIKMPSIAGVVPKGEKTGIIGNVPGGDVMKGGGGGGAGGAAVVQNITVYASNTNDIYKKLSKAAKNGTPIGAK